MLWYSLLSLMERSQLYMISAMMKDVHSQSRVHSTLISFLIRCCSVDAIVSLVLLCVGCRMVIYQTVHNRYSPYVMKSFAADWSTGVPTIHGLPTTRISMCWTFISGLRYWEGSLMRHPDQLMLSSAASRGLETDIARWPFRKPAPMFWSMVGYSM